MNSFFLVIAWLLFTTVFFCQIIVNYLFIVLNILRPKNHLVLSDKNNYKENVQSDNKIIGYTSSIQFIIRKPVKLKGLSEVKLMKFWANISFAINKENEFHGKMDCINLILSEGLKRKLIQYCKTFPLMINGLEN